MTTHEQRDRAESFVVRMHSPDCSQDEQISCLAWRAEDDRHEQAYAKAEALYAASRAFASSPRHRLASRTIRERAERERRARRARRQRGLFALAATLLLMVGLGGYLWDPASPEERYLTAIGERRSVSLADGSRVDMDTDSMLAVQYSRKHRNIVLLRGRAQFDVAHSPRRPFTVEAGDGQVRAIGTRFQVGRQHDAVQVALLEGVVEVRANDSTGGQVSRHATLAPGEALRYGAHGTWERSQADLDAAQGWTRGELRFRQRPLQEILDEANRYSRVQIRVEDAALARMSISGVFASDDQASLVEALQQVLPLRAQTSGSGEILLQRR